MKVTTSIEVHRTAGDTPAGALDGARWARDLLPSVTALEAGFHALDFRDVRLATVSWLRAGVLELVKLCALAQPEAKLIIANASDVVEEELEVALTAASMVMVAACVCPDMAISRPRVLGRLEPALDHALRLVARLAEFDASHLTESIPDLSPSAANNRLAALESKGVLASERRGRHRVYRPILQELTYGC